MKVHSESLRKIVIDAVKASKKSIYIACFEVSDSGVVDALKSAAEADVRVQVVTESRKAPPLSNENR